MESMFKNNVGLRILWQRMRCPRDIAFVTKKKKNIYFEHLLTLFYALDIK